MNTTGSQSPRVTAIMARARNGTIGRGNSLPWHIPEDLRHFKALTSGHPIIMGRNTWDSLSRPLPNRRNIVITRQPHWSASGAESAQSVGAAIDLCAGNEEIFVIGGAQIYEAALPLTDRLIITEIDADITGDTYFPAPDPALWRVVEHRPGDAGGEGNAGPRFAFVTYVRRPPLMTGHASRLPEA